MKKSIEIVGVDADDTLWDESSTFMMLERAYIQLVSEFAGAALAQANLRKLHMNLIATVGYGPAGYQRAMECYAEQVAPSHRHAELKEAIAEATKLHTQSPLPITPGVDSCLRRLATNYTLILISKGYRNHQLEKLTRSGLSEYFSGIEIVPEKTKEIYQSIFGETTGLEPHAAMIGNSAPSDIAPALDAGAYGLHVPHHILNPLDVGIVPKNNPRYFHFDSFGAATNWLLSPIGEKDRALNGTR